MWYSGEMNGLLYAAYELVEDWLVRLHDAIFPASEEDPWMTLSLDDEDLP